jgi:Flp pilus assembly protein TadD
MAVSQAHLNNAYEAFKRGDCPSAIDSALASTSAVSVRPQPFELMGYCDVRLGQAELGVEQMQNAIKLEPGSWEAHYGLALALAASGRNPRAAIDRALELNPRDPLARSAARAFRGTDDPQKWRRRALRARLPIL